MFELSLIPAPTISETRLLVRRECKSASIAIQRKACYRNCVDLPKHLGMLGGEQTMLACASRVLAFVVALLVFAHSSPPAMAQAPSAKPKSQATAVPNLGGDFTKPGGGPDMTTESYGDWIIRCQQASDAKRCELSQTLVIQGQSAPIALIAFGREKKSDPLRMVIQLPTNVTIDGGVKILFTSGEPAVDLNFRRCFPAGCFADASAPDALINKLKATAEPMTIKFKDGTEREIALPLSLRGFGPALDALLRS